MQVSKGLATWAGIIAAVGQYAAAVALFLEDPDKVTALGPLATATVTLLAVIVGRMEQAKAATELQTAQVQAETIATARGGQVIPLAHSPARAGEFDRDPVDDGRDLHENGLT